jgi:hypothetical protein
MRAKLIAALAGPAAIALLAACSAQGGSATPQPTVTVTAHPTPVVTTTVAAPASPSAAAAVPQATPCSTRYLSAHVGVSQATAGSTYVVLVLTNLNNSPCTLFGYPGVTLDAGVPVTQVGLAAAEDPATARELVTLTPHGTANALLKIVDAASYPAAECEPVHTKWLQIIPPNQYAPIYVGYNTQTCVKPVQTLTVDAVRPGSGSS